MTGERMAKILGHPKATEATEDSGVRERGDCMGQKYELTDAIKEFDGHTLHRIRAARDFGGVAPGELGGWIECESNLSHDDNAWVYGAAWVYGDAWVCGDARVYGDAQVYGNARVYGNAQVYGAARVYGDAWVCGDARVYGDAQVYGNAQVCGDAWVCGAARVYDAAWVCGNAQVYGAAWVYGNARVCGDAQVYGDAWSKSPLQIQGTRWFFNASSADTIQCGCNSRTYAEWHAHYNEIAKQNDADDALAEYIAYFNLACRLYGKEEYQIKEGNA